MHGGKHGTFKKWLFKGEIIQLEFSDWFFCCWWENEKRWQNEVEMIWKVESFWKSKKCLLDFGLGQKFWIPLFHVKSIHLGSSSSWRVKKQSEPCLSSCLTIDKYFTTKTCQTQNFVASSFKDIWLETQNYLYLLDLQCWQHRE